VIVIAVIYTIRLSNATNCTSTTFYQQLDAAQMLLSQMNNTDYTTSTQAQINAKLQELFNETAVSINCTVAQTTNSTGIGCKIIYACNQTTTTVLANGTTNVTQVNSKCNTTKVHQVVSCGLF
jgi:hypothetical protein